MSLARKHHRRRGRSHPRSRRLHLESLETRRLLAGVPFGAQPQDTAEFMLGTVAVNVVLLESNGQLDASTENWTPQLVAETKAKVREGVEWWKQTLAKRTSIHSLDFTFDFTHADNPVPTKYEPISRVSDDYKLWVDEFLDYVGYNSPKSIDEDIRLFNNALRIKHGTNWGFTIFIVNAQNDLDGQFAANGSFRQAFAFAGGRYVVSPSRRPAMTITHEVGHIFWARDEYLDAGSYTDRRGYYDTQNWNAANNPTPGFVQQDSIMAAGTRMFNAYENHTSAASTLEHLGWRDSDFNGVFDVLDVPHELRGLGYLDPAVGKYRFRGTAQVGTLANKNSSGLQSDLTINTITRAEYRVDNGAWQVAATYGTYQAELDLLLTIPTGAQQISIRTVTLDAGTGQLVTASPVFTDQLNSSGKIAGTPSISGRVWNDVDGDGEWDAKETGLPQRTVRLVDQGGQLLSLQTTFDPDQFTDTSRLNTAVPGVVITAYGFNTSDDTVRSRVSNQAATGTRVFAFELFGAGSATSFRREAAELHVTFANPQTYVALDAIGEGGSWGRLEAYDAAGKRLERVTTTQLATGQVATMIVDRPTAEIATIRAFGQGSSVQLDRLRFGPPSETTTIAGGGYWFESLAAGNYHVQVVPSAGAQVTSPVGATHHVSLTNGGSVPNQQFALKPARPWQNQVNMFDVSGDGLVTTFDIIVLVGDISRNQSRVLPAPTDQVGPHPYWDINGDGGVNAQDVVRLLTHLSQNQGSGSGEGSGPPPAGGQSQGSSQGGGRAEGEGERRTPPASRPPLSAPSALWSAPLFASRRRTSDRERLDLFDRIFAEWADKKAEVARRELPAPVVAVTTPHGQVAPLQPAQRVERPSQPPPEPVSRPLESAEEDGDEPHGHHHHDDQAC